MGHLKTISIKTIVNGLPILLILALAAQIDWVFSIIITLALTALAYIIGDLYVLPKTGNLFAALADGVIAVLFLWGLDYFGLINISTANMLYAALALMLIEFLFFHPFLKRLVSIDSMGPVFGKRK